MLLVTVGTNIRPAMEACLQQHLQGTITPAGTQRHACTLNLTLTHCCRRLTALTDCIDQYVQQQPAFMRLRPLEAVERPHQPSLVLSMAKVTPPPPHLMPYWRCDLLALVSCLRLMLTSPVSARRMPYLNDSVLQFEVSSALLTSGQEQMTSARLRCLDHVMTLH